jgi:cytochrome o ubiquinol oxidase subunit 3
MSELSAAERMQRHQEQYEADDKSYFGFWTYIMTDCVLFASLFATYAVLHHNTYGGPAGHELFSGPYALAETLVLLTSSFTVGLGLLAARRHRKAQVVGWLLITFLLGLTFLALELSEFRHRVGEGNSWRRSAFLSSFFTLVSTHGLHISVGLVWMAAMLVKIWRKGLGRHTMRRLLMLSLFWHFLDIVWIFIFTVVYMLGVM